MESDGILNLLLAQACVDDGNRLISLLRNTSYKINPRHLDSPESLSSALSERDWDIALVSRDDAPVSPRELLSQLGKLNRDTPVIIITNERNPLMTVEGLRMGATDVVAMDEDQIFLEVVSRSLYHLEQRRRERYWRQRSALAETRCERLIANSRDALAIVQDGTYVQVNDCYAHLFGHPGHDTMLLLPVIDSATPAFQTVLKALLKPSSAAAPAIEQTIEFAGIDANGATFTVPMTISPVTYQDEPALQFLIVAEQLPRTVVDAARDVSPADNYSRIDLRKILDLIAVAIRRATRDHTIALLFYIQMDNFRALQKSIGLKNTEELTPSVGEFLSALINTPHSLGRIREDAFVLLMAGTAPEPLLDYALGLCQKTAAHPFQVAGETLKLTLSIGIDVIDREATSAETCIERCLIAMAPLAASKAGNGARCYQAASESGRSQIKDDDIVRFCRRLLEKQLLTIAFQPMVALHGDKAECYEVLMRPSAGVPKEEIPDNFVGKVAVTDFAREIDRWILLEATKGLLKKRKTHPLTRLFINLGATTWRDDTFIPWLRMVIQAAEIPLSSLAFQLTELDVGRDLNRAIALVDDIKTMQGLTVLNHFGLATPPLRLLSKIPVDFIKLDRQLVERSGKNDAGKEDLKQLLNALKAEDPEIIVPCIESPAMIPLLWQHGVDYIQGHYIQAPREAMDYDFTDSD